MKQKFLLIAALIFFCLQAIPKKVTAQNSFFILRDKKAIPNSNINRTIVPERYNTTFLNIASLKSFLWSLPAEQNLSNRNQAPVLSLPMPDGSLAKFKVWESNIMEPGLAAKFPDIKTFTGQGIDDPYATVRFDYNPSFGFSAQILSVNGNVYIDPYSIENTNYYISYYSNDFQKNIPFNCKVIAENIQGSDSTTGERGFCRGAQLYTFRLAVACTGEYATAVCLPAAPTVPATMAVITTTINRVNGIYEKELAVRFLLVANNDQLVFLNATTDPYTNNNTTAIVNENQSTIDNIIGSVNYDGGHVFSTGDYSFVSPGSFFCQSTSKAKAVSGLTNPTGDLFDVNRVAHNFGHLLGANDTHNSNDVTCRNGSAIGGIEPGSGTTIMGSAGTCGPDNLQPQSDSYFHSSSFNSITEFLNGAVGTCRGIINTGNTAPRILSMDFNGAYIPINTPFTLNAIATDDNGDAITYCWDEMDNGIAGSWNTGNISETRPLFKSRIPKTNGRRTFPDIDVILAGYPANPAPIQGGLKGETLPAITRTIKFGLTVRDNRAGGGGVINDDNDCSSTLFPFEIYSVASAGPFTINIPVGGETWSASSTQTILWNVANTNIAPVSTTNVNILLSTDGGNSFPFFLAANVPNDGFEAVTMPSINSSTVRIKIEAVGNIFFAISNANFSIAPAPVGFEFNAPAPVTLACPAPVTITYPLTTISNGGYSTPVSLSATGVPNGATVSFATNPVQPGNPSSVSLNNVNLVPQGIYYITVTGVSGSLSRSRILVLNVQTGASPVITTQPVTQTDCDGGSVTFSVVSPSAIAYQWQISIDGGFVFTNISPNGNLSTITISGITIPHNDFRYRCIVIGQCNSTISNVVRINVFGAPFISTQPQNISACAGTSRTISLSVSGSSPTYQWQMNSNNGAGFNNINGATSNILNLNNITSGMNNYQYRCLVLNPNCTTPSISNIAILTVNPAPIVSINAAPYSKLLPGLETVITATGSVSAGASPFSFRWYLEGAQLATVTGSTYTVGINRLGNYRVEIIDAKGCVGQSSILNIGDSASNRLFILPNLNNGQFAIALHNPGSGTAERQIAIYNANGNRILFEKTTFSRAYQLKYYNITKAARGIYIIVLADQAGKVLAKEKMVIQ